MKNRSLGYYTALASILQEATEKNLRRQTFSSGERPGQGGIFSSRRAGLEMAGKSPWLPNGYPGQSLGAQGFAGADAVENRPIGYRDGYPA